MSFSLILAIRLLRALYADPFYKSLHRTCYYGERRWRRLSYPKTCEGRHTRQKDATDEIEIPQERETKYDRRALYMRYRRHTITRFSNMLVVWDCSGKNTGGVKVESAALSFIRHSTLPQVHAGENLILR